MIFDLDGVLVDSESIHVEAWSALFSRRGIAVTREEYEHGVGMADADWLAWLFARRGIAEAIGPWREAKRKVFQALLAGNLRPFPGAVALVRRLHREFRLGVASNSWRENIETVLDGLGVRGCFGAIVGADDVGRHKPHPAAYLRAAERLRVAPEACTVLEDSPLGIRAAKAAGMRCIGIPNTMPAERLAEADLLVSTLSDADAIVRFARGEAG